MLQVGTGLAWVLVKSLSTSPAEDGDNNDLLVANPNHAPPPDPDSEPSQSDGESTS